VVKTLDLKEQADIKTWAEKYVRNSRLFRERVLEGRTPGSRSVD
jgi:hypothetical protein